MIRPVRALLAVVVASFLSSGCSGGSTEEPTALECGAGQHVCAAACVSDTSPVTCGTRCEPCPGTANGSAACVAGGCALACDTGYEGCATGCCAVQPPAGSVRVELAWPTAGAPFASAARLEVSLPGRTELLDAPATSLTLEGLDPGYARIRLRLLDGAGTVLARGGAVVGVSPAYAAWLPVSTDAAGLSGCEVVDAAPGEDLTVDVSEVRTLTPGARAGKAALLLGPSDLAWSAGGEGVATVDAVTGQVTPVAPGFATISLRCGPEAAPSLHQGDVGQVSRLAAVVSGPLGASAMIFVRDRTSAAAAPVARLSADPPAADADFTFRLDASATTDDGPAAALRWRFDWEGDGSWDTPFGTRAVRFHQYQWPDSYAPVVQVVDGAGLTGRASLTLPVATPTGVRVSVNPTSDLIWLISSVQHRFTATVTGAADGSVTWSMLEGAPEVAGGCLSPTAATCEFQPPRASGFYHLVATPNADPSKRAMVEIEVRNQAPAADCHAEVLFGVWTDWAILGQTVVLDGSRARDPEGGPLTYDWWYLDGGIAPRIALAGDGASTSVSFGTVGSRTLGLDVTDVGGEVGSNGCGTVTWAPSSGIPMGGSVGAAYWDDPDMTMEFVVVAPVAPSSTYEVVSCTRNAAAGCWSRSTTEYCSVEGTGVGAPYLACGSGRWFVGGPETGAPHLWMGDADWSWWPIQNARGAGLSTVDVAVRGHDCLSGPLCP